LTLMLLCNCRYTAFRIKYLLIDPLRRGIEHDKFNALIASDPLGFLAYANCCTCPDVDKNPKASWYSDYQHRMLCFIGVLISQSSTVATLDQSAEDDRRAYLQHNLDEVRNVARNVVHQSDPTIAQSILDYLVPAMVQRIGS